MNWITITEYVDIETGELITKSKYLREYYKIRTTNIIKQKENTSIKKYTIQCRKIRQLKLQL